MERVPPDGVLVSEAALPIDIVGSHDGATMRVVRLRPSTPETKRRAWFLSPAVFLVAASATFLAFYLRTASVTASTPRIGVSSEARSEGLPAPHANLDMRVETQGAGLRLTWNRYSPAVQAAKNGVLEIDDGGQHREIALDRNQVVDGSVVYRPGSDDVSFRLRLHGLTGGDVTQLLRVVDASPRRPPLKATVPETPVVPSAASVAGPSAFRDVSDSSRAAAPTRMLAKETASPDQATKPQPQTSNVTAPVTPPAITPASAPEAQLQPMPTIAESAKTAEANPAPKFDAAPNVPPPAAKPVQIPAYVPPRPLKWVQPDGGVLGSSSAAGPIDIKVKVKIDETGHVTAAHALIDGGKRDKKLMAAATAAVRQWVFEPAKSHGTNVPSEETIVIHLGPEAQ